jgi:Resolvase, N terminal domain
MRHFWPGAHLAVYKKKRATERVRCGEGSVHSSPPSRPLQNLQTTTQAQGRSGLGLEAQQAATKAFLASRGVAKLLATYTEIESGKRADRPELAKALEHARLTDGV